MTTLVTDIAIRKTELHSRQKIFNNTFGIKFDTGITSMDIDLSNQYVIEPVSNFLMISTDSIIELTINQINRIIDSSNNITYTPANVTLTVSGVFMTYAKIEKVILARNKTIKRVPKVSIIYS